MLARGDADGPAPTPDLTPDLASRLARVALAGIHREFPAKLDHILNDADSLAPPGRLHPAFYGCFDWHSAVHTHWLLARLLRLAPALPEGPAVDAALNRTLAAPNIAAEVAYLSRPNSSAFERTYGWAWLLKLAEELAHAADARWAQCLAPLADAIVQRYLAYLPRAGYPIRAGTHPNSAFGLAFAHDYALAAGDSPLRSLVEITALRFFNADANYPAHLEPGGSDFLSAALVQADLLRRIMPARDFADWFGRFLPQAAAARPMSLFTPAIVSDPADLQIIHLAGLNLSRAWSMRNLARALGPANPATAVLLDAADRHIAAALPHIGSGHYAGDHWLPTFALLALTGDR